ncbi:feruloyl esterase [Terrimicrobium sacchariphilum]|uniref:Feruloyl esterase n=2 Tax=Terrimicrobium sacchariphilum TaxID=690879 RepID=A0A146G6I8_TERSA|nr:feruloyl esterase [Terrimicrobium sacchariphilum]
MRASYFPDMLKMIALACVAGMVTADMAKAQEAAAGGGLEERLARLRGLKVANGVVTSVEHFDSPTLEIPDKPAITNLPPRAVMKVELRPAEGSHILVEIWLPDEPKWNGRLLGIGNGGAAGHINPQQLAWPTQGGYAAATTDMGTAPNPDSGVGNREVWRDFGYRATHLMTVVAKDAVRAYYGRGPEYSYFNGGSTGGQQAMQEAQRYPEDYDGIVANIPAHCRAPLHAYFLWNDQIFAKCPFTKEQEAAVIAAANEYLAAREVPVAAGKFVSDPRWDAKDQEAVIALALKKDATLTPAHAEALRKLFAGPVQEGTGARIFGGLPPGSTFEGSHGNLYLFKWVFGAKKPLGEINFGADIDTYSAALGPWLNAENDDLSAFAKRGGKMIMMAGSVDSVVPCWASIDYYERVATREGGLEKAQEFLKFYLIPGMAHGGGPGMNKPPDMLAAVRAWREKGVAPGELIGSRSVDGKKEWEMPVYPYPKKTAWDAATSTYKAVDGPRGGVEPVAEKFRPAATE